MADPAAIVEFPDHRRGDHWPPAIGKTAGRLTIGPVLIKADEEDAGAAPDSTLQRVRWRFTHQRTGEVYIFDSEDNAERDAPVVIDDAATWEAHIPETQTFLSVAGKWNFDSEFYDADRTAPITLHKGTLTVTSDV